MTKDQIEAIAEYFTNNYRVVSFSIRIPDDAERLAFFKTRDKLGITGYMDKDEAIAVLNAEW